MKEVREQRMYKFDNPVEHLWHDLAGGGEAGRVAVGAE